MNVNDHMEEQNESESRKNVQRRAIQIVINFIVLILMLFISAGKLAWVWAWIYIGINLLILVVNSFLIPKDVVVERGKKKTNAKKWDKIITALLVGPSIGGIMVVSGLDFRFSWSQGLSLIIHIAGILLMIFGNALISWSMIPNKYFSTLVRIQIERNHTVSTGGPYSFVRHPGYVGFIIIYSFATPLILGSLWALIAGGCVLILLVIRTAFEDCTLKRELDGYKEYAERVKYRLVPGIW